MSEKAKRKVRLNVIDILIIILVIALIATVVYRIYTGIDNKASPEGGKYVITFETDGHYSNLVDYLTAGKAVYFANNGQLLGKMHTPDGASGAAHVAGNSESGNSSSYEKALIQGYIIMSSDTVKAATGNHYSIGEINVTVGSHIEVYTNETVFTLVVKSIDPK